MTSYLTPTGARSENDRTPDLLVYLNIFIAGCGGPIFCSAAASVRTVLPSAAACSATSNKAPVKCLTIKFTPSILV